MVDIDESKPHDKTELTSTAASTEANRAHLEETSKHIEVLLHASDPRKS